MKTAIFTILCGLIILKNSCKSEDIPDLQSTNDLSEYVKETVRIKNIPGLIVGISDGDEIISIASAGVRKYGSEVAMNTNDQVHIGSCTKAMTSAMLATLVQEDLLSWDTIFTDIFPELKNTIDESYHNVTLHELITHTGGIPTNVKDKYLNAFEDLEIKERRIRQITETLKESNKSKQGNFAYSNIGYMMAGCMAEKVTGKSWEVLMQERIFNPLEMSNTGFGAPGTQGNIDQPWGHYKYKNKWMPIQEDNPEALGPAGTIHCPFSDWVKFAAVFLPESNQKILDQDQIDQLTKPIKEDYASGWIVLSFRSWANGEVLTHSGSNTLWNSTIVIAPEINKIYMVGINADDDDTISEISDKIVTDIILKDS